MTAFDRSSRVMWAVRQPAVWAAILFTMAALSALTAPASGNPAGRVALGLILGGGVMASVSVADRYRPGLMAGVVSVVFGLLLRVDAERYASFIMLTVAATAAVIGVIVGLRLRRAGFAVSTSVITTALIGATGLLFVVYETQLLPLGFGLIGLAAAIATTTGIAVLSPDESGRIQVADALRAAGGWVRQRVAESDADGDAAEVAAKLFHEGTERRRGLIRFYSLMGFASVIASFGILTDSTAVVIGAMLIAPLMTPLMGMSLALVSAWTGRLVNSSVVALTGAAVPIASGLITTAIAGQGVDPAANTQIVSRASPNLLDLAIALAAGAAGAYANSRRDVADSLPGVAVAIALVPPLAVVGVAAQLADWASARGALLLFVTNALAIVAMGALTFVLTGIAGSGGASQGKVGNWVVAFAAAGVVVLWGLVETSSALNEKGALTSISREIVETWAAELTYDVDSVVLDGDTATVELTGTDTPTEEATQELADALTEHLGSVALDLRVNLQSRTVVEPEG